MAKVRNGAGIVSPGASRGGNLRRRFESLVNIIDNDGVWMALLWAILAGVLITVFFFALSGGFNPDELEHMHTTWMVAQGKEIYVDFFQHHHPFLYYMLTPVIHTFGSSIQSIMVSRYIMLVVTAGILTVTCLISLRVFRSREIGVISLILTATIVSFYAKAIEIRPDAPQALAGLICIYFLFVYYDNKSLKSLIVSSASLAVSFLFLQKSIVLILPVGVMLLYDTYKKRVDARHLIVFGAVFVACLVPYYLYLMLTGSFERYFMMNWVLNYHIPQTFGRHVFILETVRHNVITCVLYVIGVIALIRSGRYLRFTLLSLSVPVLTLILFKNLWHQYLILSMPLVGIIAAYALSAVFDSRLYRLIVLLGAIYVPMSSMHNQGFFNMDGRRQAEQIDRIEYVLSVTGEGDKVYDGRSSFNVFRDDIDYFWYCFVDQLCLDTYQKLTGYRYDIYDLIAAKKPKVISTYKIPSMQDISISGHYVQSREYPELYIRIDE